MAASTISTGLANEHAILSWDNNSGVSESLTEYPNYSNSHSAAEGSCEADALPHDSRLHESYRYVEEVESIAVQQSQEWRDWTSLYGSCNETSGRTKKSYAKAIREFDGTSETYGTEAVHV